MGAGIEVYNNNGILQITESYANYILLRTGTVTISANGLGYSTQDEEFWYCDMVAFRCNNSNHSVTLVDASADRGQSSLVFAGDVGAVVTYYLFSYPGSPDDSAPYSSAARLFEVYKADGTVCFSNVYKYLKPLGNFVGSVGSPYLTKPIVTITHSSALLVAIVLNTCCFSTNFRQAFKFNSGNVESRYVAGSAYNSCTTYDVLLIDVTGL